MITARCLFLSLFLVFGLCCCGEDSGGDSTIDPADTDHENEEGIEAENETATERLFFVENGFIRDASGRAIVLRGIAYPSKDVEYWSDKDPLQTKSDMAVIAQAGFNSIRQVINWDRIESEPGVIDEEYCDLVAQHAKWAAEQGLYVILDMHQDMFGMGFGLHGAPYWACDESNYETFEPADPWFFSYFTDEVKACFDTFWEDEELRRHQQNAAAAVASRLVDNEWVLGFDTHNEPLPGSMDWESFGRDALWPFHERFYETINEVLPGRMIFFEPTVLFSTSLDTSMPGPKGRFPGVFSPHYYNSTVELDLLWDENPAIDRQVVERVVELSQSMEVPWMFGELGGDMRTPNLKEYLLSLYSLIDEFMGNAIIWIYSKSDKGFALIDKNTGTWNEHAPGFLRVAPSVVAGEIEEFSWDYRQLEFNMTWLEVPGLGDSEVLLPQWVKDAGYDILLDGASAELKLNHWGRLVIPSKDMEGKRTLQLQVHAGYSK